MEKSFCMVNLIETPLTEYLARKHFTAIGKNSKGLYC